MFKLFQWAFYFSCAGLLSSCLYAANLTTKGHCTMRKVALVVLMLYVALASCLAHFVRLPWGVLLFLAFFNIALAVAVWDKSDWEVAL